MIILASGSLTRKAMLERVDLDFTVVSPLVDEDELKLKFKDLNVYELGLELAKAKALSVSSLHKDAYIIGADQICLLGKHVFDKPGDFENSFKQLKELANKEHEQICSACIAHDGKVIWQSQESAFLQMRNLTDTEIKAYIDIEKPFNACGSFMFEKHGKHLFAKVKGSEDIILGLPVVEILNEFYELEVLNLNKM